MFDFIRNETIAAEIFPIWLHKSIMSTYYWLRKKNASFHIIAVSISAESLTDRFYDFHNVEQSMLEILRFFQLHSHEIELMIKVKLWNINFPLYWYSDKFTKSSNFYITFNMTCIASGKFSSFFSYFFRIFILSFCVTNVIAISSVRREINVAEFTRYNNFDLLEAAAHLRTSIRRGYCTGKSGKIFGNFSAGARCAWRCVAC